MHLGQNKRKDNMIDGLLKFSKEDNRTVLCQQPPSPPQAIFANCEENVNIL